jgi:hypothetical protein
MSPPAILAHLHRSQHGLHTVVFGDGFKCFARSKGFMERRTGVPLILCVMLLSMMPLPAQAANSGGVEATVAQMSFSPSSPVMGGSVEISLLLSNSGQTDAFGVEVSFYRDYITSGTEQRLKFEQVDILAGEFVTVTATWPNLQFGNQTVWVEWFASGSSAARVSQTFSVQGLPNLRVASLEVGDGSPVFAGDTVPVGVWVHNSGPADALGSTMLLHVPGTADAELNVPALLSGEKVWANTTVVAPSSGVHPIDVTLDATDVLAEASENDNTGSTDLVVATRMDVSFKEDLTVTTAAGDLEGPWTVEGTLVRTNGTGPDSVPLWLQIASPSGGLITSPPFSVEFAGVGYSEQTFSVQLNATTLSSLPDGDHVVVAKVNPFNEAGFVQEDTSNDEASGILTIFPIPDVYVDAMALPTVPSVQSGEDVEWRVTMENIGDIGVSGRIQYTFDGLEGQSPPINLGAGQALTWTVVLSTALGAHTAEFDGQWVAAQGSYDANKQNSFASGTVLVESKLKLDWEYASLQVNDVEGNPATMPLRDGDVYTLTIGLTSQETGQANYTCQDSANTVLETMAVTVENRGDRASLSCTFSATASTTTVRMIPEDASISTAFQRSFATLALTTDDNGDAASSGLGTMTLFGLGALVLIGVLVAAVFLTREREEEVERDIYEYCPSCDGELEGTEDRCPHCVFNLKKARSQFHDCNECGESIPDLMENCAYCGAFQDVASYFERRERRERRTSVKEIVSLPEEEDDDDQIVTGDQNFADAVKEFGFDEEHLEEEWDTNIEAAEAEVEAAYDRRYADELAVEDMTEEELEAYKSQVTTTLRTMKDESTDHDVDAFLSEKGELKSLGEDTGELSASDADIRERLFEITGEEGVLPGEKVKVGMTLTDSSLAGNEVSEATANFTFDDDVPLSGSTKSDAELKEEAKARKPTRRRAPKRQEVEQPAVETDECGACGADLPVDANECTTCGAKFG